MSKTVVTRETLSNMAQRCAKVSEKMHGLPALDDAAELLEEAAFRVAELEDRLDRWERVIDDTMPVLSEALAELKRTDSHDARKDEVKGHG